MIFVPVNCRGHENKGEEIGVLVGCMDIQGYDPPINCVYLKGDKKGCKNVESSLDNPICRFSDEYRGSMKSD